MNEEVMRILEMVKDEKITAEEGEKLIGAIGAGRKQESVMPKKQFTMLRVRVDADEMAMGEKGGKAKVTVNLPLAIAKKSVSLLGLVPYEVRNDLREKGIDLDQLDLRALIESFEQGEINEDLVNVEAGDGDDKVFVRVYVD